MNEQCHLEQPCGASSHWMRPPRTLLSACGSGGSHCEDKTSPGSDLSHKQRSPSSGASVTILHSNLIRNECSGHNECRVPVSLTLNTCNFSLVTFSPVGIRKDLFDLIFDDGSRADVTGPSAKRSGHAHSVLTAKDSTVPSRKEPWWCFP